MLAKPALHGCPESLEKVWGRVWGRSDLENFNIKTSTAYGKSLAVTLSARYHSQHLEKVDHQAVRVAGAARDEVRALQLGERFSADLVAGGRAEVIMRGIDFFAAREPLGHFAAGHAHPGLRAPGRYDPAHCPNCSASA